MYVYILTNPIRTVLYIGMTNDIERRMYEHSSNLGDVSKFTGRYQVDLLIYFEHCADAAQAIAREKQLKGWTRAKIEMLIHGFNPEWVTIDPLTWKG